MARDVNLMLLDPATGVTALAASAVIGAAVDCEGGFYALVRIKMGTIEAGTTPSLDITIEASLDGGTTYKHIGAFPQMINTEDDMEIARPVWIPRPDPAKTTAALGKGVVWVRIYGTVVATADYDIKWAYLEPLLSLGGPAGDLGPTGTIGVFTATTRRGVEELAIHEGA